MKKNTEIKYKYNPSRTGMLTGNTRKRNEQIFYQVKHTDGSIDYVHEKEIQEKEDNDFTDHYSLLKKGEYGRALDLRQHLTFVHLSGRLANLVYSMDVTNTDFYPHQYKPLLALLESPANGFLLADEVGLGKTIEAGLVWTELRVRYDMRRLLIICPAMLREKWRDELRERFGINATIVKAKELYESLNKPKNSNNIDEAWIASYTSLIPPRDWKSNVDEPKKTRIAARKLCDFFEEQSENDNLIDTVIFDEAHYMRNDTSAAHTLGNLVREVSDFTLLLSATPINNKNLDLFHLLKLADPEHFKNKYDFNEMLASNAPLIMARDIVLNSKKNKKDILNILKEAQKTTLLKLSSQLKALINDINEHQEPISKKYRAEISETIEKINLLGHVITRTRKRDIQSERPTRRVHREAIKMTLIEKEFYSNVTESIRNYAEENQVVTGFLLATFQRQVASCPAATFKNWTNKNFESTEDINEDITEKEKISLKDYIYSQLNTDISYSELYKNDSKFNVLKDLLIKFRKDNKQKKIIIFTSFRATAKYLTERLGKEGINSMLLWGSMERPKQEYINEFKVNKQTALISTEVASEGVDLQFCNFLVNYDLPWNPMRIEQRIGRIDRLGQESDKLFIWNFFYKDSIDERIITRLMDKINIFEEALGSAEAVVGELITKLESKLLIKPLSREEEDSEIERASQAIENEKKVQQDLERNSSNILSHGGLLIEKIEAAKEFSRRITDEDLIAYVQDYLTNFAAGHSFSQDVDNKNIFEIKLPPKIAAQLDEFIKKEHLFNITRLSNGSSQKCNFINKVSSKNSSGEVINQFHPLIRFISKEYIKIKKKFYPLVAIKLNKNKLTFEKGLYIFCVKRTSFEGIGSEEHLRSIAYRIQDKKILTFEESDQLINTSRLQGNNFLDASKAIDPQEVEKILDELEMVLDQDFEKMFIKKTNENKDRISYQKNSVEQHAHRKLPGLTATYEKLLEEKKMQGARLTKSRIDKLKEKTSMQLEKIKLNIDIKASKNFVCSGVIQIL